MSRPLELLHPDAPAWTGTPGPYERPEDPEPFVEYELRAALDPVRTLDDLDALADRIEAHAPAGSTRHEAVQLARLLTSSRPGIDARPTEEAA